MLLRRVRDRMDLEYDRSLDVTSLARAVHLSPGHFSRQFKAAYRETPYQYLMTRRIERAMTLLRTTDMSVTEVCFTVGCGSLGTFSTRFSELVGVPPSVYRAQGTDVVPGMLPCIARQITRPRRERPTAPVRNREAGTSGAP